MGPSWRLSLPVALFGLGAGLVYTASPAPAHARPIAYAVCVPSNHTDPPCPTSYHIAGIIVIDRIEMNNTSALARTYSYDPKLLSFNPNRTSLLCDLRSASSIPYCPDFPAGTGTTPLSAFPDTFTVDQTYLAIEPDSSGLPSVRLVYKAPAGTTFSGERNFLALAFDLLPHVEAGATLTYGDPVLPGQSFLSGAIVCLDASGVYQDCGATNPPGAFTLNPVPAPLAVGVVPMMAHASRRLRQRIRRAAG